MSKDKSKEPKDGKPTKKVKKTVKPKKTKKPEKNEKDKKAKITKKIKTTKKTKKPKLSKQTDYKVGYSKTPKNTRFKKGQSGNPKGRPKGSRNRSPSISNSTFRDLIISSGLEKVSYMDKGEKLTAPKIMVMITQLTNKAAGGNLKAIKMTIDLTQEATAKNDKERYEWLEEWFKMKEELLMIEGKKGTLEHFLTMRKYYIFKKDIRSIEGVERWPYEDEEPIFDKDWAFFMDHLEQLELDHIRKAPWPLDYPRNGSILELQMMMQQMGITEPINGIEPLPT